MGRAALESVSQNFVLLKVFFWTNEMLARVFLIDQDCWWFVWLGVWLLVSNVPVLVNSGVCGV